MLVWLHLEYLAYQVYKQGPSRVICPVCDEEVWQHIASTLEMQWPRIQRDLNINNTHPNKNILLVLFIYVLFVGYENVTGKLRII